MREARSYSIVDHALLHGGHLGKLSHAALALYLFLVVVGDRNGRSFYSDVSIGGILRLSFSALTGARQELVSSGLVRYRRPYWHVESLTKVADSAPRPQGTGVISRSPAEPRSIRGVVPEALRELIRSLEERS